MDRDILLHELAHGLANLHRGCARVVIKWDDVEECAVTTPHWPDSATPDDVFIGLLAGRLHTDGVNTTDDELLLSQLPKREVARLWGIVVSEIEPKFRAIPKHVLDDMLDCFATGQWIEMTPELLH